MALAPLVECPVAAAMSLSSLSITPRSNSLVPVSDTRLPEINLLLSVQPGFPTLEETKYDQMQVFADETIKDIKMRLRNRAWFTAKHCIIFGDRELLEHEIVADVAKQQENNSNYLHMFVRLADIDSVHIRTMKREFSLNYLAQENEPKSALTAALRNAARQVPHTTVEPASPPTPGSPPNRLIPTTSSALATPYIDKGRAVVHIIIRKSAKVSWKQLESERFELDISGTDTVETIKRRLQDHHASLNPEEVDVMYGGYVLAPGKALAAYGVTRDSVLELAPVQPPSTPPNAAQLPDGSPLLSSPLHQLHADWLKAREGLAEGMQPQLAKAGSGGSYFFQDVNGRSVAVFKPEDEEPLAANNPRGLSTSPTGEGLRRGTRPGEGAVREVAAYVLDHGHFSCVPPTALVSLNLDGTVNTRSGSQEVVGNPGSVESSRNKKIAGKIGSLQQFVNADFDCEERGASAFPVQEVHKIAILDMRLANTDRNGGNILCRKVESGTWELVPIDHGYCLPDSFEDISFEWLYWPQAQDHFTQKSREYIAALNAERDISLLEQHSLPLRAECKRVLRVCTMLLQRGAARGLTPFQIGRIMSREGLMKSPLEKLHHQAVHQVQVAAARRSSGGMVGSVHGMRAGDIDEGEYLRVVEQLVVEYLDDVMQDEEGSEGSGSSLNVELWP